MNRYTYSLPVKLAAVILFVLFTLSALGALGAALFSRSQGLYNSDPPSFYGSWFCDQATEESARVVFYEYFLLRENQDQSETDRFALEQYEKRFSRENSNLVFWIRDGSGNLLLTNETFPGEYGCKTEYSYPLGGAKYTMMCAVREPLAAPDRFEAAERQFSALYSMRYACIAIAVAGALIALLLFIYLLCAAGHKRGEEGIALGGFNRLPLDIYTLVLLSAGYLLCRWFLPMRFDDPWEQILAYIPFLAAVLLICLGFCMTLAARMKKGKWWKNTLFYIVLNGIYRALRSCFHALPLVWGVVGLFFGYTLLNSLFLVDARYSGSSLAAWFGLNGLTLFGLSMFSLQLRDLWRGGEKIAQGDLTHQIDTSRMLRQLKNHGQNLNHISSGMAKAVESRMKSERFKTELITNVSHDIKTPLTSIVNYVDLLKKEDLQNEQAAQYVEVLDRQAKRLKKLTEDLFEASKASTGTLPVNIEPTDISELIGQSLGEYAERFSENGLETVAELPPEKVTVLADGRLLWRVFDNLLCNICKYALPNTRIYLTLTLKEGRANIEIKNISRDMLNISAEDLMERFVRGDSSRNTEGSGLGLAIARSLTELQRGAFQLAVDGDLFKAALSFPLAPAPNRAEAPAL